MRRKTGLLIALASVLAVSLARSQAAPAEKKLIEFGWDEPDTAFMRQHIEQMERSPFDGCVFHVDYAKPNGGKGSFTWESWGARAFTPEELQPALEDLRATRFGRFRHNFLRFNTTPARRDWFDDHAAVLRNAELAARVAREGRGPGLLFDIEQYDGPLFNYRKQRDAARKSWDDYAAQARARGHEVMEAFQRGYPDLTVFLTFGYSLPWAQSRGGQPLANCDYGLLAPFLDGMLAAARGRARLVDGHELSYGYKDLAQFERGRRTMKEGVLPLVAQPQKYPQHFSFSFGLWLDHDWRKRGWDTNDVSKNYFTPPAFETAVRHALEMADEYVWIYSETPRWWSKEGQPVKLPAAYDAAVRRARGAPDP
jgi:hypothetical protein